MSRPDGMTASKMAQEEEYSELWDELVAKTGKTPKEYFGRMPGLNALRDTVKELDA